MLDLGNWGWYRFRGTWGFLYTWNKIELYRFRDKLQMEIVWRLPLWVINWAVVRAAVLVFRDDVSANQITYRDMFKATDPHRKKLADDGDGEESERIYDGV